MRGIDTRVRRKLASSSRGNPEEEIHREIVRYLRERGYLFFHVPNESKSAPQYRAKLKALGLSRGVPDLIIISSPPNFPECRGAALELKSDSGRASPEQKGWISKLGELGWAAEITKGRDASMEMVRDIWGY